MDLMKYIQRQYYKQGTCTSLLVASLPYVYMCIVYYVCIDMIIHVQFSVLHTCTVPCITMSIPVVVYRPVHPSVPVLP